MNRCCLCLTHVPGILALPMLVLPYFLFLYREDMIRGGQRDRQRHIWWTRRQISVSKCPECLD